MAILYLTVALILVLVARILAPGGYSPAQVWAYAWAFAWACQGAFGQGYNVRPSIVALIFVCNVALIIGAVLGDHDSSSISRPSVAAGRHLALIGGIRARVWMTGFCIVVGFVELNAGLQAIGAGGISSIFGGSFAQFGSSLVTSKSSLASGNEFAVPVSITISATLQITAAVLSGIDVAVGGFRTHRATGFLLAGVGLLAFATSAGTGVRNYLLIIIFAFGGAFLAGKVVTSSGPFRVSSRTWLGSFVVVVLFLAWAIVVQSARRGDFSFDNVGATLDYLRAWFAGYIPALSAWTSMTGPTELGWGSNLLRGLLGPLGLVGGEGIDQQIAAVQIGDSSFSNAMTVFRVLILDFGYPGALLICAVAGYAAQRVFRRASVGSVAWAIPLAAAYAGFSYAFNYWFFAYGSRIAGFVLAFVVIAVTTSRAADRSPASKALGMRVRR